MSKKENLTTKKASKLLGERIIIPAGYINIGKNAFEYRKDIKSIIIPDSVVAIGRQAFKYCSSLEHITIPNSVTTIREDAFHSCKSLTSITIPDHVVLTEIQNSPMFSRCKSLTNISVSANHIRYSSQDGVLLSKDKTTLIRCPEGMTGSYIIPESVKAIRNWAFYNCDAMTSVIIPDSVRSIYSNAFAGCRMLTYITIPDSVQLISRNAFMFFEKDGGSMVATYKGKVYKVVEDSEIKYVYYNLPQEFYDAINRASKETES